LLKRREISAQAAQEAFLMANATLSLDERLSAHPQLKERVEALLAIVEDSTADVQQADEAEHEEDERDAKIHRRLTITLYRMPSYCLPTSRPGKS